MAAVAVGDVFEDEGTVAGDGVLFAVFDGGFDGEDVHSVDFEAWDVLAAFVVFGQGGGAVGGGAHAVFVVCVRDQEVSVVRLSFSSQTEDGGWAIILSQPKRMGRFHSLAMLKASKT